MDLIYLSVMHKAYLLLGSNLGDSRGHLQDALHRLSAYGKTGPVSSVYRSAAWGNTDQPDFLNLTTGYTTDLSAPALLQAILRIESGMGRKRLTKWGPRVIDIDILLFDDVVIDTPDLIVPHPEIRNRRFTLVPLTEIAPGLVHPVLQRSISDLLLNCADELEVERAGSVNDPD